MINEQYRSMQNWIYVIFALMWSVSNVIYFCKVKRSNDIIHEIYYITICQYYNNKITCYCDRCFLKSCFVELEKVNVIYLFIQINVNKTHVACS